MAQNRSEGVIQIFSPDVLSINAALMDLQNRVDALKGLRGRAMVYDRIRTDNPEEGNDAVTLQSLQAGTAFASIGFQVAAAAPLLASAPGTTYVEVAATLRQQINFASPQGLEARLLVSGWGTESGTGKGVALTTSTGTVLCELTWDGATEAARVGSFTAVTQTTDQVIQLRVKGSSVTESLLLYTVMLDMRYAVDITV